MHSRKVIAACIFNELQAASLFLALDGTSTHIDPSTSGRKYRKLANNAVFIPNESLFADSAVAMNAFQLKHMPRLLRSICPAGYQIRTIEYGKILVMLLYGKYYWCVYEVYNKIAYNFHFILVSIVTGGIIFTGIYRLNSLIPQEVVKRCLL